MGSTSARNDRQSVSPSRRGLSSPRPRLCSTVNLGTRFSSWWMKLMPSPRAAIVLGMTAGVPSMVISPASG